MVEKPKTLVHRNMEKVIWSDESSLSIFWTSEPKEQAWMLDLYSEGIQWICYAVGAFCTIHLEGRITANQYNVVLSDHLYPMMKHFYPDGSGLPQDDNTPIHSAWGVTEWFEYENDVNHILWPSHSADLNPVLHPWETCRINAKTYWGCSGGTWWPNT